MVGRLDCHKSYDDIIYYTRDGGLITSNERLALRKLCSLAPDASFLLLAKREPYSIYETLKIRIRIIFKEARRKKHYNTL